MNRGYTRLYRKIWDNQLFKQANHKFSKLEAWLHIVNILANGIERDGLGRGEFEASYGYMARAWRWSKASVYKFISQLIAKEMLKKCERQSERQSERYGERFIVCNYNTYNPLLNASVNGEVNGRVNKSNKGIKESIKKDKNTSLVAPSETSIKLAQKLKDLILKRDPNAQARRANLNQWAKEIDKILRLDDRQEQDVEAVIKWCQKDPFWQTNILSGKKLRMQFDRLYAQMKQPKKESDEEYYQRKMQED